MPSIRPTMRAMPRPTSIWRFVTVYTARDCIAAALRLHREFANECEVGCLLTASVRLRTRRQWLAAAYSDARGPDHERHTPHLERHHTSRALPARDGRDGVLG